MWILNFYWILNLLMHTWLSGSILLPILVLIRWGGSKWKRLNWLTGSRRKWLLIWGCFGIGKEIFFAALVLIARPPDFASLDVFGWAGSAVQSVIFVLHTEAVIPATAFVLAASLSAVAESAIAYLLAAIAWWIHSVVTQKAKIHREIATIERYTISLLFTACGFGIANVLNFLRPPICFDCFQPYGIPFTFFHEGGFAGGVGFVWKGVIGDSLVILFVGFILGLVWNRLALRHMRLHPIESQAK